MDAQRSAASDEARPEPPWAVHEVAVHATTDCVKVIDSRGHLLFMNEAGCRALGVDARGGFGQHWLSLLPEEVREAGSRALAQALAGRPSRFAGRSVLPGGAVESWDNVLTPVDGDEGERQALCVSRNITDAVATHNSVVEGRGRLALAAAVGHLGVWDLTIATGELVCDQVWHHIMGLDDSRSITAVDELRSLIHPDDAASATEVSAHVAALVESGQQYSTTFRIIHPNGDVRTVHSEATLVMDALGTPTRAVGFIRDVTDEQRTRVALKQVHASLQKEARRLERLAVEDPLTGLPNRRALETELARVRTGWSRSGARGCMAMLDVDHFKTFNDSHGHAAGDSVLRGIADCLRRVSDEVDFIARYGGEEFLLIFDGSRHYRAVLERILTLIRSMRTAETTTPARRLTASCGYATFVGPARPEDVLAAADSALYEAKTAGRDRVSGRRL